MKDRSPRSSSAALDGAGYRLQHSRCSTGAPSTSQVWRFTPGGETALLTGDIGSGKSTLVDALTTLLLPPTDRLQQGRRRRHQGAHPALATSKATTSPSATRPPAVPAGRPARRRRTYSVILGVFANDGYDETVTLAQVFQQRDSTGQPDRFFVTADKQLSIATDFAGFGSDLRDLRRRLRGGGAEISTISPSTPALRRLLGIRSEQALDLFHQTVSMKSVGNLNDFVRDHMLEPCDATERGPRHHQPLRRPHQGPRRGQAGAGPARALDPSWPRRGEVRRGPRRARRRWSASDAAVRLFIAELRSDSARRGDRRLEAEGAALLAGAGHRRRPSSRSTADERDALIEERANAGGDRIGELERLAREARRPGRSSAVEARALFDAAVSAAGLEPVGDADEFAALSALVADERPRLTERSAPSTQPTADAIGREKELRAQVRRDRRGARRAWSSAPATCRRAGRRARPAVRSDLGLSGGPAVRRRADRRPDEHARVARRRGARAAWLRALAAGAPAALRRRRRLGERAPAHVRGRGGQVVEPSSSTSGCRHRVRLHRQPHDGLLLADARGQGRAVRGVPRRRARERADYRCAPSLDEFRSRAAGGHPRGPGPLRRAAREGRPASDRRPSPLGPRLGQRAQDRRAARRARGLEADVHEAAAELAEARWSSGTRCSAGCDALGAPGAVSVLERPRLDEAQSRASGRGGTGATCWRVPRGWQRSRRRSTDNAEQRPRSRELIRSSQAQLATDARRPSRPSGASEARRRVRRSAAGASS